MNLFKKYVTPVLLVAIVASCSSIEAIDFNNWLDCARSVASQAYDVLTRKRVWMPIAATATALCLLKMTSSGKKIWKDRVDDFSKKHKKLCEEILDFDPKEKAVFDSSLCIYKGFLENYKNDMVHIRSIRGSFFTGVHYGASDFTYDSSVEISYFNKSPFSNCIRGFLNCSSNISHRLALQCTNINGQIDEQVKRIETSLQTLETLKNLKGEALNKGFLEVGVIDGALDFSPYSNIKPADKKK